MQGERKIAYIFRIALVLVSTFIVVSGGFAEKQPKAYPEEGKVVGTGTKAYMAVGAPSALFASYRVETDTKIFELLCSSKKGCGGDKKLQVGDVVHFRIDKYHGTQCAFLLAPEGNNQTREDKLLILSEDLKPADKSPETQPEKNDVKPQGARN